ncbi:M23 family metallopeptidase [Aestuariimicrobium soli]|uniref:M23 family metallopeptidase n=1 Tax=Aestuariimicrobium soli TaxID=2035834 RepID=UPI003EBDB09F
MPIGVARGLQRVSVLVVLCVGSATLACAQPHDPAASPSATTPTVIALAMPAVQAQVDGGAPASSGDPSTTSPAGDQVPSLTAATDPRLFDPGHFDEGGQPVDLTPPTVIPRVVAPAVSSATGKLLSRPVTGPITSSFGMRVHPITGVYKLHTGTDFGVPIGTPVGAAAAGRVLTAGWGGAYGIRVTIDHGIIAGHHVVTSYNHLSSLAVRAGDVVVAHQGVGRVGSTGYSTGAHLHFEVIADGNFTDPVPWLDGRAVIVDLSTLEYSVSGPTPGSSPSSTPSAGSTASATPSAGSTPSASPTPSPTPSRSPSPSHSPTPSHPATSQTPSSPTPTSPTPSSSPTPSPSATPSSSPTPSDPASSETAPSSPVPSSPEPSPSESSSPDPSSPDPLAPEPSPATTSPEG